MSGPIVEITDGLIKGCEKRNLNGEIFLSFEGIPYGKPPVGALRFKEPQPVEPWKEILNATCRDGGNYCKHVVVKKNSQGEIDSDWILKGSEDCLKLNVYTRSLPKEKNEPKAVMFFIHGGGFITGSTNEYHPEPFMSEDIVLVTIHYRLGALGFLAIDDPGLELGNAGMKDMVLALKWVQNNIHFFNGDSKNVTIFGQSAGGASVNFLLLSKQATGLYHKAIIQSGCALNHWTIGDENNGKKLAESLGFKENDPKKILAFLQNVPVEKLYEAQCSFEYTFEASSPRYFAPVVENKNNKGAFLTEERLRLITNGEFAQVPIMMGYTDMETSVYLMEDEKAPFNLKVLEKESLPPHMLGLKKGSNEFNKIAEKISKFYYGDVNPELVSIPTIISSSDNVIVRGVIKLAEHFRKTMKRSVYIYKMSTPMVPLFPYLAEKNITGVPHGAELYHLFRYFTEPKNLNGKEKETQKILLKLWTNFAKFGDPTPKIDELIGIKWNPIDKNRLNYLDIADRLKMDVDPEMERMEFWESIFGSYPHTQGY